MELEEWDKLSPEEKRVQLYLKQKKMLEDFLELLPTILYKD